MGPLPNGLKVTNHLDPRFLQAEATVCGMGGDARDARDARLKDLS